MSEEEKLKKGDDSNARILAILSVVFFFVPIIGLILGIVASEKGRKYNSTFARRVGYLGIILSIVAAISFGYIAVSNNKNQAEEQRKEAIYIECVKEANERPELEVQSDPEFQKLEDSYVENYFEPGRGRDIAVQMCENEKNKLISKIYPGAIQSYLKEPVL